MWRSGRDSRRDDGFSLVEVVVALGILVVLVVSTLPPLLGGIKGNDLAREVTQAKSVALAELERMRNLPFHVAPEAGDFIDVLDRYYPNLTAGTAVTGCTSGPFTAPSPATTGYVAADAARCGWEPAGAFWRRVRVGTAGSDLAGFTVVIDTQFLDDSDPPAVVPPPTDWSTSTVGRDTPPADQLGVTVTVFPQGKAVGRPLSSYAQVARTQQAPSRIRSSVDVSAFQAGTSVRTGTEVPLSASAGLVNLTSGLSYASTATATLASVSAATGSGAATTGATSSVVAPPSGTTSGTDAGDGSLDTAECGHVCWGGTHVSPVSASASSSLPKAGSPTAPLTATVKEPISGRAFRMGVGVDAHLRPELRLDGQVLRLKSGAVGSATSASCAVSTSGTNVRVGSSGWLRSTSAADPTDPLLVEACGTSRTSPITVLSTDFAPEGVVRVQLVRASVRCRVAGTSHAASTAVDYEAIVERWTPGGYVTVATITPGTTTDVLAAVPLDTTPVGTYGVLGDWIQSWSGLTPDRVRTSTVPGAASVSLPGVVTLLTRPLRLLDPAPAVALEPASGLSLTVGALACTAEDAR